MTDFRDALGTATQTLTTALRRIRELEADAANQRAEIERLHHELLVTTGQRDDARSAVERVRAIKWPSGTEAVRLTELGHSIHDTMRILCLERINRALDGAP